MRFLSKLLVVATFSTVTVLPASAATYVFDMIVTESIDDAARLIAPEFDLPEVGSFGTVSISLDSAVLDADGDPDTGVNAPGILDTTLANASASFGALSLVPLTDPTWFGFPGLARLSNTSFASIAIGLAGADCSGLACTLAGSFRVENPAYAAPSTFGHIEAMLADPASSIFFSFNGSVVETFVSFAAERAQPPGVVPLPASGLLLLGALAAIGLARRRRAV